MTRRDIVLLVTMCGFAAACASHERDPLDPDAILRELDFVARGALSAEGDLGTGHAGAPGERVLAAFAVARNPLLATERARLGMERAMLVEAGLLPDVQLSWGASEVLASRALEGSSSAVDAWAGFGFMVNLMRPGERGASRAVAEARVEEARHAVVAAEWGLTREVYTACAERRAAELLLARTRELAEFSEETAAFFERARDAGAATAIEANLARGQVQKIRIDLLTAEVRAGQARRQLNTLLGLSPGTELTLGPPEQPDAEALETPLDVMEREALHARPDLAVLLARYEAAEQGVRLAVARQYPALSIGTGFQLSIPMFSGFGRPGIRTAIARRDVVRREFVGAVASMRREIADASALWEASRRRVSLIADELLPNAERNLVLSQEALVAGEATLLETLALQRALVEARTLAVEADLDRARHAWELLSACGKLLAPVDAVDQDGPETSP